MARKLKTLAPDAAAAVRPGFVNVLWPPLRQWPKSRGALLLMAVAVALAAGSWGRKAATWDALVVRQPEVARVIEVRAVGQMRPGQWVRAFAEIIPQDQPDPNARDIATCEALLSADAKPMALRDFANLTRTPNADEWLLDVRQEHGGRAWAATRVGGAVTALVVFRADGDPFAAVDGHGRARGWADRVRIALIHQQESGVWRGIGLRSLALVNPVDTLSATFSEGKMWLVAVRGQRTESVTLTLNGDVTSVAHEHPLVIRDETEPWVLGSWTTWAVGRARAEPAVGAAKIAALESYVFDVVETFRRGYYGVVGVDNSTLRADLAASEGAPMVEVFAQAEGSIDIGGPSAWPPSDLAPLPDFKAVVGEGRWTPWIPKWDLGAVATDRPWPVYRTTIRVNPRREYDAITLVAMDMRQLRLDLVAGTHNPRSTTGVRGDGKIPRQPRVLEDLVLTFNGGFKTSHGAYGMMLNRRTWLPPKPATATLAMLDDGTVRMGTWPGTAPLGNYRTEANWASEVARVGDASPPPANVVSLRQNLPPLVQDGKLNPGGARRWGGSVARLNSANTPRSGVCVRGRGTLIFVWGPTTSARSLGQAMIMAGCDYGMHLDMNPFHTGIAMYDVPVVDGLVPAEDEETGFVGAQYEVPAKKMWFDWYRWLRADLKDFFYVTRKRSLRDRLPDKLSGYGPWGTRGLPVASGGVDPIAVIRSDPSRRASVLVVDPARFEASIVTGPAPPAEVVGELLVTLSPIHEGAAGQSKLALAVGEGGRLRVARGKKPATPGVWGAEPGSNGSGSEGVEPVLFAETSVGDLVIATCLGCSAAELAADLAVLGIDDPLVVSRGGALITTADASLGRVTAHAHPPLGSPTVSIRLRPRPVLDPMGVSDFEGHP